MEIIAIPLPFQGHLNPMLQLCSCLHAKGLKVTLVLTHGVAKSMQSPHPQYINHVEFISDGNDKAASGEPASSFEEWQARLRAATSEGVAAVIEKRGGVKAVVHDSVMWWLLDVGRARGKRVVTLFTQPASLCSIYHHMICGNVVVGKDTCRDPTAPVCLPSLPVIEVGDLPSFAYFGDIEEQATDFNIKQAFNLPRADWFFINTFDALEDQVVKWMTSKWPVKTIGPLVPIMHNKTFKDEKHNRINMFELDDERCMKWLDMREPKSVVYVSFGSVVVLSEEKMKEIAWGLAQSNKHFIWVVRDQESKLPLDFKSETSEKGVIVKWCPQLKILSHRAIACFVTHCGWNSILEALCSGVPMVGMPHFADQPTNAKLIEDVWGVGVRVKVDEKGNVMRDDIRGCIKEVTEGVKAEEFKRNAMIWKGLAEEALMEVGSSDLNIKDFISQL